jgi:sugar lactone lactonase YvrE
VSGASSGSITDTTGTGNVVADGSYTYAARLVDLAGNVFCTGPGGIWVCRADGTLLGRIVLPELPANLAWGEDGSVLFITARTSLYRLETKTRGALPA